MNRLLVTGGSGQVAQALARAAGARVQVIGRPEFDFENEASIAAALKQRPTVVVNAAAWTAVDAAETAKDAAYRANAEGPGRLAALCRAQNTPLIHISTDYVFDGEGGAPYVETAPTNPTGVYGASKRQGEENVLAEMPGAIVLRTSWVYAESGKNFLRTMLAAGSRLGALRVVDDQAGCPTNADDLAAAILAVAGRLQGNNPIPGGIYHAAGSGDTTWFGFARAIFSSAARFGVTQPELTAITTQEWPTPARRPADSRLNCDKLAALLGVRLPHWRVSLDRAVAGALAQGKPA